MFELNYLLKSTAQKKLLPMKNWKILTIKFKQEHLVPQVYYEGTLQTRSYKIYSCYKTNMTKDSLFFITSEVAK